MEVKEFKEAIMFLENTLYMCIRGENEMPGYKVKYNHWINKVIALLQQGEAYRQIVEKWWDEMSYIKKSTIIKGGEHLCVPERSQNYEEFWDDLTPDEKIKVFDEYKSI